MRWMADLYAEADKRFVGEPEFEAAVRAILHAGMRGAAPERLMAANPRLVNGRF